MSFRDLFPFGNKPVLGLDVGEHSVKYALVCRRGREFVVEHCGIVDLKKKDDPGKNPYETIRTTLTAKGVKSFRIVVGISGQSIFLRFVRLPPVPRAQMDQIVRYEAQQQVPFPIEDVRWDYQVLNAVSQEERDVLLVAVKSEIVEPAVVALHRAGLNPLLLDASVLAIYNCLNFGQSIHPGTSSLILDIGARTSHMIVADRGGLWIRNIPIAGNHFTEAIAEGLNVSLQDAEAMKISLSLGGGSAQIPSASQQKIMACVEKVLDRVFAEVSRSLGFYRSQYPGATLHEIDLCGGGSLLKGLDQAVKERFNLPVKRLDCFAGFRVSPEIPATELARKKVFLAGALGLTLRLHRSNRLQIDLTPFDVRRQRTRVRKMLHVAATCFVVLATGAAYWIGTVRLVHIQQMRINALEQMTREMEVLSRGVGMEKEQLEVLKEKFKSIDAALSEAQAWPMILSALQGVLPRHFWLTRIAQDRPAANFGAASAQEKGGPRGKVPASAGESRCAPALWGTLLLEGKTSGDIQNDLPLFREALLKIPYFSDVEVVSAQVAKGIVEFSLKIKVKNVCVDAGRERS